MTSTCYSAFDKPGRVDLLLGLDVYSRIQLPGPNPGRRQSSLCISPFLVGRLEAQ